MDPRERGAAASEPEVYVFADFTLDVEDRTLLGGADPVPLAPKSFDLLVALVRQGGRLASKDDLLAVVWNDATVTEASLAQAVSQLRRALGEDGGRELIATVPKAGYRLAVPVCRGRPEPVPPGPAWRAVAWVLAAWVLAVVVLAVAGVAVYWVRGSSSPRTTALERSSPAEERQWQEAKVAMAEYRFEDAIPALDALFGRLPDRVEIGLDLVRAHVAAGQGEAAEVVLGRLRQLPPQSGEDPRIDLAEAEAALAVSSYQRAAVSAVAARRRGEERGSREIVLRARLLHGEALRRLGQTEAAKEELEAVRQEAESTDDALALAQATLGLAAVARRGADGAGALALQREALERFRAVGDLHGEIEALRGLGELTALAGEFEPGRQLVEQAIVMSREIGDSSGEGEGLVQLATVLNYHGDTEAAIGTAEQALPLLRRSGNRRRLLATVSNLAISEIDRGRLAEAEGYLDEADPLAVEVGSQENRIFLLRARGYLAEVRGDFALARSRYGEALETAKAAGTDENTASLHYDLAVLARRDGQSAEVVDHSTAAEALSRRVGDLRGALMAGGVHAVGEALEGDIAGARRRIAALRAELADPDSLSARQGIASCEADVEEIAGDFERSLAARRESLAIVEEWGDEALVLEERLGVARALRGLGRREEALDLATEVREQARLRGLLALAAEARDLLELREP